MNNHCPICSLRISDWMIANGKTVFHGNMVIHKSCLQDWRLVHGSDWPEKDGKKND